MKRVVIYFVVLAAIFVSPAIESAFAAGVPLRTVQCEVTNQSNPDTLWLGWPQTMGTLTAKTCTLSLMGDHITLTLPGTTTQTSYALASANPLVTPATSTSIPTTATGSVTLVTRNSQPYLTEGGTESYVIQYWIPKANGPTMTVSNGINSYRISLTHVQ